MKSEALFLKLAFSGGQTAAGPGPIALGAPPDRKRSGRREAWGRLATVLEALCIRLICASSFASRSPLCFMGASSLIAWPRRLLADPAAAEPPREEAEPLLEVAEPPLVEAERLRAAVGPLVGEAAAVLAGTQAAGIRL